MLVRLVCLVFQGFLLLLCSEPSITGLKGVGSHVLQAPDLVHDHAALSFQKAVDRFYGRSLTIFLPKFFRSISPELLVHSEEVFNASFLVCRVRNHSFVNGSSDFPVAVLAVCYYASKLGSNLPQNSLRLLQYGSVS